VDKYGDPSRPSGTIEWEGTAERVALHYPYVLLFDSRFIEIRHIATGRLVQIIPGNYIRCVWDGRGPNSNDPFASPGFDTPSQEAHIHAFMNEPDLDSGTQFVFELIPTAPL
jgi:RHO1 GDP-GTP exchange protein 1/2